MITPIPAMKPTTIGSDRKSASQPSFKSPIAMTMSPATSAVAATSSMYCVEEAGARRSSATAKSGAMVESAPTETIGFEPTSEEDQRGGDEGDHRGEGRHAASCDVASCSGIAMASSVTPARN